MNFYVYLILSKRLNRYITYVGYTNNIEKRIYLHNPTKVQNLQKVKMELIYKKNLMNKSMQ